MTVDKILAVFRLIVFLLDRAAKVQDNKLQQAGRDIEAAKKRQEAAGTEMLRAASARNKIKELLV